MWMRTSPARGIGAGRSTNLSASIPNGSRISSARMFMTLLLRKHERPDHVDRGASIVAWVAGGPTQQRFAVFVTDAVTLSGRKPDMLYSRSGRHMTVGDSHA